MRLWPPTKKIFPLISCVMPTYGRPEYVNEAVAMFLAQDYPHKKCLLLIKLKPGIAMLFCKIVLVTFLSVVGTMVLVPRALAMQPGLPSESNLAQARFRLAVFNRDETRLLTATLDLAELWDLKTGNLIQSIKAHDGIINSICFSPDEQQILTSADPRDQIHGLRDPTARLWDVQTGKAEAVMGLDGKKELGRTGYVVKAARFSPDGRRVLAMLSSPSSVPDAAVLWNLESREIELVIPDVFVFSSLTHDCIGLQFSPDGRWLVGQFADALQVQMIDSQTGKLRWTYVYPGQLMKIDDLHVVTAFGTAQFSSDGKMVLAIRDDNLVSIWDSETGQELQGLKHNDTIQVARFFSDEAGDQVLTASEDATVRLWDPRSGQPLKIWELPGLVYEAFLSPSGHRLFTSYVEADKNCVARLWDTNDGRVIQKYQLRSFAKSVMSPTGRLVLCTVTVDGKVKVVLIETESGKITKTF